MENKRIYPRLDVKWPVYLVSNHIQEKIGYVNNVSLSGFYLTSFDNSLFTLKEYSFILRQSDPINLTPGLYLNGKKRWAENQGDIIHLGIAIKKIKNTERTSLVHLINRRNDLDISLLFMA